MPQQGQYGPEDVQQQPAGGTAGAGQYGPEDIGSAGGAGATGGQPAQNFGQRLLAGPTGDFFTQAEKSLMQSVNSVGELINKIPKVGKYIMPQSALQAGQQAAESLGQPRGLAGQIGSVAEPIAEAALGDEALKGMAIGDKLLHAGKVADWYEKAGPIGKRVIEHGLNLVREMGLGGAVGGLHGGTEGAVTGAALGALPTVVRGAAGAAGQAVRGFPIAEELVKPITEPPSIMEPAQPVLQDNITKVAQQIAKDAGVKLEDGPVKLTFRRLADAIEDKSKEIYDRVDAATQKEFYPVKKNIESIEKELAEKAGTMTPEYEGELNAKLITQKQKFDELIELANKNGIPKEETDQAVRLFRQKSAIEDLDSHLQVAMPGHLQAFGEPQIDTRTWSDRVEKMYLSEGATGQGRLAEAMNENPKAGQDMAAQVRGHAYEGYRTEQATKGLQAAREETVGRLKAERAERVKGAKKVMGYGAATVGLGAATGVGGEAYKWIKGPEE